MRAAGCFAIVLLSALVSTADAPSATRPHPRPIVGALRWDAWHSERGEPGRAVEKTLSPRKWHGRLPFYARIVDEDEAVIDAASPEVMRQEIEYAAGAGLDYWAFVTYPPGNPMSLGLSLYLQSPRRDAMNFCLILQGGWTARGGAAAWPEKVQRYISLMEQPTYQKVLDGRPLLYLFDADGLVREGKFTSWEEARSALAELRDAARKAGLRNPYIVAQAFSPAEAQDKRELLGLDAVGSYAVAGGTREGAPYAALRKQARSFWERAAAQGSELVPLVTSGWDKRPRAETPVPWESRKVWEHYEQPTPAELAEHLRTALEWVNAHPTLVPSRTLLIYAWNENDEGAWLLPTQQEGTARLDALREVLVQPVNQTPEFEAAYQP